MKAKRIISLLLTVAMVAACGVTAFAATAPVAGYKLFSETALEGMDVNADKLYGVLPELEGENAIRVDVDVTPVTDEEFAEMWDMTPQDCGADESWVDSTYLLTINFMNLGELYYEKSGTKYNGFKVVGANVTFEHGGNVVVCQDIEDEEGILAGTDNSFSDEGWSYNYSSPNAKASYPSEEVEGVISVEGAANFYVFAEAGTEISIADAYVLYNNFHQSSSTGKSGSYNDGTDCKVGTVAAWAPATITLGEAEGGDDPVVNPAPGAVTGGTTGVAFKDGSDIYDNAFEVSATFSNADAITAAGVLFIPAAYYDGATLDKDTENVAIAEYVGNAAGNGTITIRAAIKGIPRGLVGEHDTVDMRVKSYLRVNDAYTYGDESTVTIDVTEIAPKA